MVANERAVTKREVPGGSERLGRGGDPLAPNSGEGFSLCLYPHSPKQATTNKQEWFQKSIPSMCWRSWTSCLGFRVLIIPTAIEFTGIESYERLSYDSHISVTMWSMRCPMKHEMSYEAEIHTESRKATDFPHRFFTFSYRARILKTPQIPSLSSSRAAADETSSSGSVPAHAWIYIITLLAIPV